MKFLDLFAGIGGFRKGMEAAGHECVGFCEWDRFARASYISMHLLTDEQRSELAAMDFKKRQKEILENEKYLNGEWCSTDIRGVNAGNVPRADIWCFGAPCFAAGTMITTRRGMVPIEEVVAGDMVLTHKGRFKRVTRTMARWKRGICFLHVEGAPLTAVTLNHWFYVKRDKEWNPEWLAVEDCEKGDLVLFPDGGAWRPIISMEYDMYRFGSVYNLEVEDDNSYTANNMGVHNCQDFSIAGQRQGLDGDRSSLVREVFRIVGEIGEGDRPEWLVYENVKGMLTTNGGRDYLAILLEMDGLGYDCQWQVK